MRISLGTLLVIILFTGCSALEPLDRPSNWQRDFFSPATSFDLEITPRSAIWATSFGIYHSSNGIDFSRAKILLPGSPRIVALATHPLQQTAYAVTDQGLLLRSIDNGAVWEYIGDFPSIKVHDLALTGDGLLLVASSSGVLLSATDLDAVGSHLPDRQFLPWESLVMALPIWRGAPSKADTAVSLQWTVAVPGNAKRIAVDPSAFGVILANLEDDGTWISRDEGALWAPAHATNGARISGTAAFFAGRIIAGHYLSLDNGATFRSMTLPFRAEPKGTALTEDFIWLLDDKGTIYRSADGVTWMTAGGPADFHATGEETPLDRLISSPKGVLYVATNKHGLFHFNAN